MGCHKGVLGERVLFDFESDAELDRFHWKCHTLFSISDKHVTHGTRSLKLELYPSDYPGLSLMLKENDWRGYSALCFDVYNTQEKKLQVSVRIDDQKDYPDFEERYNRSFILEPRINKINIPLGILVTSGKSRNLNLEKIYRLFIFMEHPDKKVVLYIDHIRLI